MAVIVGETFQFKATITAEDIANGKRYNCVDCPVAIALSRGTSETIGAGFPVRAFTFGACAGPWTAKLPGEATDFMDDFDEGKSVSPFEFDVTFTYLGGSWQTASE